MTIRAILFDFDGVIADSEPVHARAKRETLLHHQIPFTEDIFDAFKGRTDRDFFEHVNIAGNLNLPVEELVAEKKQRYEALFSEVHLIAGCLDFLKFCRTQGYTSALVTSATRHDLNLAMQKFALHPYFDVILTADDGMKHKPDAAPYIKATELLGVSAAEGIVIEDSPNGVRSGSAAGIMTIGITTSFTAETLYKAGATKVVHSFNEVRDFIEANER